MQMKYLYNIGLYLTTVVILTSCLKERTTTIQGDGPRNIIEFKNTGDNDASFTDSFYPLYTIDLGSMDQGESKPFNVNLSYSGANVAPSDITIQLEIDQSALDRFNDENETDFIIPPTTVYSFPPTVVIKKGERVTTQEVKVNLTSDYDFNDAYVLPLRIKSVSPTLPISANFGAAMYSLNIRNSYDGIYSCVTGFIQRYSAPGVPTVGDALNGSMAGNPDVTLRTVGAYTVEISNLQWHGGGGIGGINNLRATVDPVTHEVTMKSLGNPTLASTPGLQNTYDPATKTFTLNFDWNPAGASRVVTDLVLKYKKER